MVWTVEKTELREGKNVKQVCIIGHFGFGLNLLNGQTIKAKTIANALEKKIGESNISKIDTHGGLIAYIRLPVLIICALLKAKNVVILPAHNGVKIISPMLKLLNYPFKRSLHYVVVGGWLPELVEKKEGLKRCLKSYTGIYVETNTMKEALEKQGFRNVFVMPNCKDIKILNDDELIYNIGEPFSLCTFSRVMPEKGIEYAINAVKNVNDSYQRIVYRLDIYGQIEEDQKGWFNVICKSFPEYVHYCGKVDYSNTVETIKNYFALLFPTRFYTEGIPGTIIDALAAGVPVISSKWESFSDIIDDNATGIGYSFEKPEEIENILVQLAENPDKANRMKINCIKKAKDYSTEKAINILWGGIAD